MLKGKKILLGITGSIAAYKSNVLVRLLVKAGAEVKVVMTPASLQFTAPLTLSTLSRNEVLHELSENDSWNNHVLLGRWADLMLIAPLSCHTLSKMAAGHCDNLLLAVYLSSTAPVVVAPAMDEDMWHHPSTQRNLRTLESFGHRVIPVEKGELASGLTGSGRMAEPEHIIQWLSDYFSASSDLAGKRVLITAGPTQEPIDAVRFIGNHSSGKMGIALAEECMRRGAQVVLVCGPTAQPMPAVSQLIRVRTAEEMLKACLIHFPETDIALLSAAVADYRYAAPADHKIKKSDGPLSLELVPTPDILKTLGEMKQGHQRLVGFALETDQEEQHAREKLKRKNADFIVLNSLRDEGAGFGGDTNKISIFGQTGEKADFPLKSKKEVAADILQHILSN